MDKRHGLMTKFADSNGALIMYIHTVNILNIKLMLISCLNQQDDISVETIFQGGREG